MRSKSAYVVFLCLALAFVPGVAIGDTDADADGWTVEAGDCNDMDPSIHPYAREIQDGKDNDCDMQVDEGLTWYEDADLDGHGDPYGEFLEQYDDPGPGWSLLGDDCDDGDQMVYPGAPEIWYDNMDSDCGADNDFDQDGDGFVAVGFDWAAGGTAPGTGDCADMEPSINPGAPEIWYDDVDQDCDGWNDYDADYDLYVSADYPGQGGARRRSKAIATMAIPRPIPARRNSATRWTTTATARSTRV